MGIRNRRDPAIELIEQVPGLASAFFALATGEPPPPHDEVSVEEVWEYTFYTHGIDSLLLFREEKVPQLALVLRAVHDRLDHHKDLMWAYLASWVGVAYQCPAVMIVIADSPDLAAWAREPIDGGLGRVSMRPVAVCLGDIEPGDDLGLGLLHALSGKMPAGDLKGVANRLAALPFDQAEWFAGVVDVGLSANSLSGSTDEWRGLASAAGYNLDHSDVRWMRMRVYDADFSRATARSVVQVLEARGYTPTARARTRILTTDSRPTLERWLGQAAVTDEFEQLFGEL